MNKWAKTALGDLIDIKHGFAFKGEFFQNEPNGNILLTPGNFHIGGGFKSEKFKYYNGEIPEDYVLHGGEIVVTMTDLSKEVDTLGYSAIVPTDSHNKYLHNQRIGLVIPQGHSVNLHFIYWLMRSADYRWHIISSASGSTVSHTSPARIREFTFDLPTPPEQEAIAGILSSLDDKIDLLHRQNQTLEALAQTLFRHWFVDNAQDDWEELTLGDILTIVGGTTPSTKNPEYWDGDIHWTTPRDLSTNDSPFLLDTARKITRSGLANISSGLLPRGTLLLSSRAPIGYIAFADVPIAINQGYIAILDHKGLSNYFMYLWLRENMAYVESYANGSTFLEISKSAFRTRLLQ